MGTRYANLDGLRVGEGYPVRVMGVVNLSSESFYKESITEEPERLEKLILKMEKEGADLIDVGGSSTAPAQVYGTQEISIDVEIDRISKAIPVIRRLTDIPISIDTIHSPVAEKAIDLGVSIVNDVSGLQNDSRMIDIISSKQVSIIIMANCDKRCKSLSDSIDSLKKSVIIVKNAGIEDERIVVDPGIGFGKPTEMDISLIRRLREFLSLGHPLLVGVSRKAFIGEILEQPNPDGRLVGTIAATAIAVANGADIIRAHDVEEARIASKIGESLRISGDVP